MGSIGVGASVVGMSALVAMFLQRMPGATDANPRDARRELELDPEGVAREARMLLIDDPVGVVAPGGGLLVGERDEEDAAAAAGEVDGVVDEVGNESFSDEESDEDSDSERPPDNEDQIDPAPPAPPVAPIVVKGRPVSAPEPATPKRSVVVGPFIKSKIGAVHDVSKDWFSNGGLCRLQKVLVGHESKHTENLMRRLRENAMPQLREKKCPVGGEVACRGNHIATETERLVRLNVEVGIENIKRMTNEYSEIKRSQNPVGVNTLEEARQNIEFLMTDFLAKLKMKNAAKRMLKGLLGDEVNAEVVQQLGYTDLMKRVGWDEKQGWQVACPGGGAVDRDLGGVVTNIRIGDGRVIPIATENEGDKQELVQLLLLMNVCNDLLEKEVLEEKGGGQKKTGLGGVVLEVGGTDPDVISNLIKDTNELRDRVHAGGDEFAVAVEAVKVSKSEGWVKGISKTVVGAVLKGMYWAEKNPVKLGAVAAAARILGIPIPGGSAGGGGGPEAAAAGVEEPMWDDRDWLQDPTPAPTLAEQLQRRRTGGGGTPSYGGGGIGEAVLATGAALLESMEWKDISNLQVFGS